MSALGYHWSLFRKALSEERAQSASRQRSLEAAFLPAALEVIERPVSPTGRISAWVLLAGLVVTMAWLVFGRVDVVATAQGRIVPTDAIKLIQAANTGIVRRIYIHEGDIVQRGRPLVDLDPTVSAADEVQAMKALLGVEIDVSRNRALVSGLGGGSAVFVAPPGTSPEVADTQRRLIATQIAANIAETSGLAAARASALSDASAAHDQVLALNDTGPVLDLELAAMNNLAAQGYAPGLKLLELQRQRRSEAASRDVAAAQEDRGMSEARRFAAQIEQSGAQARQTALSDLAKAENEELLRREELTKARQRSRMQRLFSPVDGTVQQLAIHTIGGVVEPARPLMVVVPNGALTVEAKVENRDAGFVRVGQLASIKLEAFPFTRYGAVPGHIISISRDSVQEGKTPPYYIARLTLDRGTIDVDGRDVPLTPGLVATADIKIGRRRIISYLLDPIESNIRSAGREH